MTLASDTGIIEPPTAELQAARIFEWRRGFNAMHLIDIGVRLGLFDFLSRNPDVPPERIATSLGLHAPYVAVWCMTAYSFGLLDAEAERLFRLAPFFDQILANPSNPRYLGGYVRLGTEFATDDHRYCLDAFRTGSTRPFQGRSPAFAQVIAEGTAGLQILSARRLLPSLPGLKARLDSGGTVAEIGCGTGRHLIELAKSFPSARCIGVDIDPTGIELARAAVAKAGLADRVQLIQGDMGGSVKQGSIDAIVMIEVLHELEPRIRQGVIGSCHRALAPGGWLLIVDETYPTTLQEARRPEFLFPIQTGFEELTWGNVLPTREEQESLLRTAGFRGEIGRSIVGEGFTVLSVCKQA